MNKWTLVALIPLIFLGLFGSSKIGLALPDSTVVSLDPALSHEIVGNDVYVNVVISNVVNLYRWEFQLFYETDCLNALSVTEGPFLNSFAGAVGTYFKTQLIDNTYNSTHGVVWAFCLMKGLPPNPATGNGVLATIKFRGSNGGMSHMDLAYPGLTYPVRLDDSWAKSIPCTTTGADVNVIGPGTLPLDVNIDVGTLYFAGEQVQFYFMTTYCGVSLTPTHLNAMLYNPNGESMQLTPQVISTGFYKATYTMPSDASPGTWAIVVEADYFTDTLQAYGKSFKTYLFSSTLNSKLVHIDNTVAWIQTNVGLLQTDVSDLQLHVTAIEGSTATIQTTLGTLQGTITSINNNIATIRTDIGTVKVDISTVKANTTPTTDWTTIGLYISLALLVSIAVVLVVLYVYLRARFRSEAIPS